MKPGTARHHYGKRIFRCPNDPRNFFVGTSQSRSLLVTIDRLTARWKRCEK
jgi:hypothetical protein